jgi:hypothetical protein
MKTAYTKVVMLFVCSSIHASLAHAAVNVDYRNHDSKEHVFNAVCSGSKTSITFEANTTGSATLQGSAPCLIEHADDESFEVRGGEDLQIKNGVIAPR